MHIEDLLHDSEDVHEQVRENWHFVMDTFPVPKRHLVCPQCSETAIQLSSISYGVRNDSAPPPTEQR